MGINEKRQQQRSELYGKFVSVKNLIDYLAEEESLGIGEIAAELETVFVSTNIDIEIPEYGYVDEPTISFVPYSTGQCKDHLGEILSDTIMCGTHGDSADHHGWLRDDLFPFLREHRLGSVFHILPWQPGEVLNQPTTSHYQADSVKPVSEITIDCQEDHLVIKGLMFSNFLRAVRAFPDRFPHYRNKLPLAKKVKTWIHDSKIETSDRPAQVFATMVLEHFSTDT